LKIKCFVEDFTKQVNSISLIQNGLKPSDDPDSLIESYSKKLKQLNSLQSVYILITTKYGYVLNNDISIKINNAIIDAHKNINTCINSIEDEQKNGIYIYGSQIGCEGDANGREVLQKLRTLPHSFVEFREEYFDPNHVSGGTCTAMSLDMATRIEKHCPPKEVKNFREFTRFIKKISIDYSRSTKIFRDRQSAFNSISVSRKAPDPARAKVEALASYHSLAVDIAAPNLSISIDKVNYIKNFIKEVDQVSTGTYLIRNLKLADNHKLEEHGHSTLLIKTRWGSLYYDPNYGIQSLTKNTAEEVMEFLTEDMHNFQLTQPRLYRLSLDSSSNSNLIV